MGVAQTPVQLRVADAQGRIVLANDEAAKLLDYPVAALVGLHVEALVPDAIRPRHADFRAAYAKTPRPRPMGTQMDLVARRRDGSEVMVEIALSPLQEQGLPYVVAAIRGIGSYPRVRQALQRAHYAEQVALFGRLAVDARDPEPLVEQVPRVAVEGLQVRFAAVYLLQANRLDFRVAACAGAAPGESVGDIVPNRQDTLPGHVLAEASALRADELDVETRFAVPEGWRRAGVRSALAVPLLDRGRVVGAIVAAADAPARFGDDELRFLDALGRKTLLEARPDPEGQPRRLLIKGHFLLAAPALAARYPDARFLTVLRAPERRLQSLINFLRCQGTVAPCPAVPWPWLVEYACTAEVAYCETEQTWFQEPARPRRCVVRFDDYLRDLPGTMQAVYHACLDRDLSPHVPRVHAARVRSDYSVDRSLAELGVDEAALKERLAAYRRWCAAV